MINPNNIKPAEAAEAKQEPEKATQTKQGEMMEENKGKTKSRTRTKWESRMYLKQTYKEHDDFADDRIDKNRSRRAKCQCWNWRIAY